MNNISNNKVEIFLKIIKELIKNKFTGQVRINLHEGNLSEKIEKKESIKI